MPSERFDEFADRFMRSVGAPDCDLHALIDELIELHAIEEDEFNRVRLISMHIALTNIAATAMAEAEVSGDSIIGFLAENLSAYHLMLRQESLVDGEIDKATLLRVTEREITAGRMKADDPLRIFAEGGEYRRDNPMDGLFRADPSADDGRILN
jgi:hypothetical protein